MAEDYLDGLVEIEEQFEAAEVDLCKQGCYKCA